MTVMLLGDAATLRGEAAQAFADLRSAGGAVQGFDATLLGSADVIVDALLGIGVRAPLRTQWLAAIEAMNACGRPVFALDIPSGLDPDSGRSLPAVRAAATMSFIALKQGLYLGDGRSMWASCTSMRWRQHQRCNPCCAGWVIRS